MTSGRRAWGRYVLVYVSLTGADVSFIVSFNLGAPRAILEHHTPGVNTHRTVKSHVDADVDAAPPKGKKEEKYSHRATTGHRRRAYVDRLITTCCL